VGDVLPAAAICARVDGELVDLSWPVDRDVTAEPVLPAEPDGLHVLRHSTAHVMAQAVCDLYPGAKYAIGPPIQDGFYYDFELSESLTPDDLGRIEARMRDIAAAGQPFVREELDREAALARFADQPYKREIIETAEVSEGALGDRFSVYRNDGWADLCLGPHVPSTNHLGAFKLLSLAAAPAHLRNGVGHGREPRRLPPPARGGRTAGPPQARTAARPVLVPRRAGVGVGSVASARGNVPQAG
jgi:threonyl-tRNA synthetase